MAETRERVVGERNGDAARLTGCARDQSQTFEGFDHLVDAWWGDAEEALHVGLSRGSAVDQRIGVDEGEVLALELGEGRW